MQEMLTGSMWRVAWPWSLGVCGVVLVATSLPGVGGVVAGMLAAAVGGGAAAFWLGNARHSTAEDAASAAAFAGTGALLGAIVAFVFLGVTVGGDSNLRWGGLFVGLGFGLINLGLSTLSGALLWICANQTPTVARS